MNAPVTLSTHISGLYNKNERTTVTLSTHISGLYNKNECSNYEITLSTHISGLNNYFEHEIDQYFRDISLGSIASLQRWQLGRGQRHEHFSTSAMEPVRQRNDSATNKHFGTHQLHRRSLARALLDNGGSFEQDTFSNISTIE